MDSHWYICRSHATLQLNVVFQFGEDQLFKEGISMVGFVLVHHIPIFTLRVRNAHVPHNVRITLSFVVLWLCFLKGTGLKHLRKELMRIDVNWAELD